MNFRPSETLATRLKEQADAENVSVQHLLSKAAEEYLVRHNRRKALDDALDTVMGTYADALRRLGE